MIPDQDLKEIILKEWNKTDAPYSTNKTIHQLFEDQVVIQPDKIALQTSETILTYTELNSKANQIARLLKTSGIPQKSFIGIFLPRSCEMIVALIAILKNGSAYVPLNIGDPENRVLKICETANIEYIITTNEYKDSFNTGNKKILILDQLIEKSKNLETSDLKLKLNTDIPAYIIFTSGTTGTPKGVLVKHLPVINLIEWVNNTFNVNCNDKIIWVTNLSFDLSVYDIFGILAAGATIRILDDKERLDPELQVKIILEDNITFWDSAPQSLQRLIPYFSEYNTHCMHTSLRMVFLSGDWIPLQLPDEIKNIFKNTIVVGLGGATEATIWSNYFIINHIDQAWKSIPYGKPIQNAKYYILDQDLNHCGILEEGDLYIGGKCLASEYYNDRELTNKKFINDPFSPGNKMYHTGDLARWMTDGNIEFLGRKDQQVKIRGYRVELGEIKHTVLSIPDIKDCVVVPDKTDLQNIKIFLFYIPMDESFMNDNLIESELIKILPEYMVPSGIYRIACFPMTLNSKIDNNALLNHARETRQRTSGEFKDQDLKGIYKILFNIWSDLLDNVCFTVNDNFNSIGGDSLFVFRLMNKLKELEGYSVSFKDLNSHPTINKLGDFLLTQNKNAITVKTNHNNNNNDIPLSVHQKRIWINTILNPGSVHYNLSFVYQFTGNLNIRVFKKSLGILFKQHQILFSKINNNNLEPYFNIEPHKIHLHYHDYSNRNKIELNKYLNGNATGKVDIFTDKLYSLFLFKTGSDQYIFQFNVHHIIFDGLSLQVFIKDLGNIYNKLLCHIKKSDVINYLPKYDFSDWDQSVLMDQEVYKKQLEYWKEQLTNTIPVLSFPLDFPRPSEQSGRGQRISYIIGKEQKNKLQAISRKNDCSLFNTMLSFYSVLIHKYTSDKDFCIGIPVSNRPGTDYENKIGMFVNTLVIRFLFEDKTTINQLIQQTKNKTIDAVSNQDIPIEDIVTTINPERFNNINPFFQVSFAWQENMDKEFGFNNIQSKRVLLSGGVSPFDISLYMWENKECIEGEIEYNPEILSNETIVRLKNNFLNLISKIIDNQDTPVGYIPMIPDNEKLLIDSINNTKTNYPKNKTIAQVFEKQADLYPEKPAVVFKKISLTYKQLNEKANKLAHLLKSNNVKTNDAIAILMDRSTDMIVSILGILKSGGCYVPLDPEYPEQRKNFILKDSGCKALITQQKYVSEIKEEITVIFPEQIESVNAVTENIKADNNSSDLAYIIYTSGSTGVPKGTLIPHKGVVRLVCNTNYVDFTDDDKILQSTSVVFDASTVGIFGSLLNGATLFLIEKSTLLDPALLGNELLSNNITITDFPTALFTQIAEVNVHIFSKLKTLLIGGDIISVPHINKLRKVNPGIKIINEYGPTENSCNSTAFIIEQDFIYNIPIGKPISNSTAYIFDRYLNYQPVGIIGEIYVGGDGLSKGYINRDDLNKTCFIDHPYIKGEKLYRTGDLARWLPDGNIEFHGRADNQIKIRGCRIELGEIEAALTEIEEIIEAYVKPVKNNMNDIRLIAFLNVPESFSLSEKEIEHEIKTKLPAYMCPSDYRLLYGFPKNINGKIDRKAPVFDIVDMKRDIKKESNVISETEHAIFKIWCETLKYEDFSVSDNFFEIGGNSLTAISVFAAIQSEFKIQLPLRLFFDSPRIKDLAETIDLRLKLNNKKNVIGKVYNVKNIKAEI